MIKIFKEIEAIEETLVEWRRDLHAHPELAFEEHRTSKFVAEKLREFNIEVEENIAGTGVVGTLRRGSGNLAVGLRADLDALPIQEENNFNHRSKNVGKMHAAGMTDTQLCFWGQLNIYQTMANSRVQSISYFNQLKKMKGAVKR